ncbi:MAG: bifunctional indole-3-glycerol-phosphate synthase TrpC/phosphoribosylanthranilate isomerase TrpF, partial [Gammaproteobacteria bacterium]|nr:bifunctional indole-3-glycerol-phosphate synthase TrpC/phosphoribosylanthranilate isomerase TrpF [Gammaproteobacteria bacterium]
MYDSLRNNSTGIIFECKSKSPSRGVLIQDYKPAEIAKQYADYAAGISVLTEPDYFNGDMQHLVQVRAAVDCPVLCKDFIVDVRQIKQARAYGADCILLMLSVISDDFWNDCATVADDLSLDILTEVHKEEELQRAIALGAKIIGINNRDLHSLTTDLAVSQRLAPTIPEDRVVISESGIRDYNDLRKLAPNVDGYLIGTSMMQSGDIAQAVRRLIFSEVKICGLTNREDLLAAYELGATWGGLIFTTKSARFVDSNADISWALDSPLPLVGVFLNQTIAEVIATQAKLSLSAVQLHGNEAEAYISDLRSQLPAECQIWQVLSASDTDDDYPSAQDIINNLADILASGADRLLIDLPKDGQSHELDLGQLQRYPELLLAGGLGGDSTVLNSVDRQAGIDICSAVEASPGKKDLDKLTNLFNSIRVKTRYEY